jgi:hypothetical protein
MIESILHNNVNNYSPDSDFVPLFAIYAIMVSTFFNYVFGPIAVWA